MKGEFVAAMEDVLDLYAEPYDPSRPVVCFDETSNSASGGLADVREPLPAHLGDSKERTFDSTFVLVLRKPRKQPKAGTGRSKKNSSPVQTVKTAEMKTKQTRRKPAKGEPKPESPRQIQKRLQEEANKRQFPLF